MGLMFVVVWVVVVVEEGCLTTGLEYGMDQWNEKWNEKWGMYTIIVNSCNWHCSSRLWSRALISLQRL